MSSDFIEAVARGVDNDWELMKEYKPTAIKYIIDHITVQQAIAIRDNKLEEYIINLLGE
tara:strand:- start:446 stop:622 length:177 start_codon:yes stop_codon:yes gene_type:complete